MFVPTQSQEASPQLGQKAASESQRLDSCPFSVPLQLSVNAESCSPAQQTSQPAGEDSQATQIEELEEPPAADTSASPTDQTSKTSSVPGLQTSTSSHSSCAEEVKVLGGDAENNGENVQEEAVKESSSAGLVSCSQRMDPDGTVSSCVEETPSNTPPCALISPSIVPPTATEDPMTSSPWRGEEPAERASAESSLISTAAGGAQRGNKGVMEECEEEVMEEECTVSGDALGAALALSQSQLLTPEPMEEDSVVVVTDGEPDSEVVQNDAGPQVPTSSSQPPRDAQLVSTNGHEPPLPPLVSGRMSQGEGAGPDEGGGKDKILSDSSGGETPVRLTPPPPTVKPVTMVVLLLFCCRPLLSLHASERGGSDWSCHRGHAPSDQSAETDSETQHPHRWVQVPSEQTVFFNFSSFFLNLFFRSTEISPFAGKSEAAGEVSAAVAMAASAITPGDGGESAAEQGDGKLSLRMKLVTPVEELSSDRFSLQSKSCVAQPPPLPSAVTPSLRGDRNHGDAISPNALPRTVATRRGWGCRQGEHRCHGCVQVSCRSCRRSCCLWLSLTCLPLPQPLRVQPSATGPQTEGGGGGGGCVCQVTFTFN